MPFPVWAAAAGGYVVLQKALRWRIRNRHAALDPKKDYDQIVTCNTTREFHFMHTTSLFLGLLRTFAIPSVAKLLVSTRQLVDLGDGEKGCIRRLEDTTYLLREMWENGLFSERCSLAVQRMNHIHAHYRISNDDYLYVLSVFLLEPVRLINRWDWRKLHPVEMAAHYEWWAHMGRAMGIRDIPPSYEAFDAWNRDYEERNMIFHPCNAKLLPGFEEMGKFKVRAGARRERKAVENSKKVLPVLLDDRLKLAMGIEVKKHPFRRPLLWTILKARIFVIRHLALPRLKWGRRRVAIKAKPGGRYKPRWEYFNKRSGHPFPYKEGYKIEDLGPTSMEAGALGKLHCPLGPGAAPGA